MAARGLIAKFATVSGASMVSRVLGLAREALMAAALAAGPVADVFYTCFRFPNVFRRLFAEGAFNIAFVPLFAKELEGGGEEAARKFGQQVFAVLASWLLVLTGLAIIAMPYLVSTIVAPGFTDTPQKYDLAVTMTRIMFPYLLFMSLVAMFSGVLNSLRKYFLAAIAPALLNVILVSILLYAIWANMPPRTIGLTLAWGVFVSGIAQFAVLLWGVRKEKMHFSLTIPRLTAPVKRLLVLMGPSMLTGGVLQINILIGTVIATQMDGANALLNYADRLNQLPLGIIGIAVGVVLLPELSRALKSGDVAQAQTLQNRSLEFALALTLPAAIGLMLLPADIIRVVYERGAFTAQTTALTAQALIAFASGLPAYVLIKVFQPAFFSREDMKTPFYFSLVMVIVNVVLSLSLFPILGHVAIALATSLSSWVNVILLAGTLLFNGGFNPDGTTIKRLTLIMLGSVLMAGTVMGLQYILEPWLNDAGFVVRLLALSGLIVVSAFVYFGFIVATGVIEKSQLRRLKRS